MVDHVRSIAGVARAHVNPLSFFSAPRPDEYPPLNPQNLTEKQYKNLVNLWKQFKQASKGKEVSLKDQKTVAQPLTESNVAHARNMFFGYLKALWEIYGVTPSQDKTSTEKRTSAAPGDSGDPGKHGVLHGAVFDLRDHPPSLPAELARRLSEMSFFLTLDPSENDSGAHRPELGASPLALAQSLLRIADIAAVERSNHAWLSTLEVTSQVLSMGLALLDFREHALSEKDDSSVSQQLSSLVHESLHLVTLFASRIFEPGREWTAAFGEGPAHPELVVSFELNSVDKLIDKYSRSQSSDPNWGTSPARRKLEEVLSVLNGWLRCSGERAAHVVQYQQLRMKLIHLLRGRNPVSWVVECIVALLTSLPLGADDPETDQHHMCYALILGVLGQIGEPIPKAPLDSLEVHIHQQRTIELLRAIRRALNTRHPESLHRLLIMSGALHVVASVLEAFPRESPSDDTENRACLATAVVRTIIALTQTEDHRQKLAQDVGYARLWRLLVGRGELTEHIVNLIFETAVGAKVDVSAVSSFQNHTITNPEILKIFIQELPNVRASEFLITSALSQLSVLVSRTYLNLTKCCEAELILPALEVLGKWREAPAYVTDNLVNIVEVLGCHSISSSALSRLLNLLHAQSPTFRKDLYMKLQQTLRVMCRQDNPTFFVDLNGPGSMIWVPSVERPLGSTGYTFHAWVRVEGLTNIYDRPPLILDDEDTLAGPVLAPTAYGYSDPSSPFLPEIGNLSVLDSALQSSIQRQEQLQRKQEALLQDLQPDEDHMLSTSPHLSRSSFKDGVDLVANKQEREVEEEEEEEGETEEEKHEQKLAQEGRYGPEEGEGDDRAPSSTSTSTPSKTTRRKRFPVFSFSQRFVSRLAPPSHAASSTVAPPSSPSGARRTAGSLSSDAPPSPAAERAAQLAYEPRLYSFFTPSGQGMEAFFSGGRLTVRSITRQGRSQAHHNHTFSYAIPLKKWVCITIVHSGSIGLISSKGEVSLYVNGSLVERAALKIPVLSEPLVDCRIGRGRDAEEGVSSATSSPRSTSLRAQFSSVYLLEPVSEAHVAAMATLGANYYGMFEPVTLESTQYHTLDEIMDKKATASKGMGAFQVLIESRLDGKVAMLYSAKLCNGVEMRDQASFARNANDRTISASLSGTLCEHHNARDVINTIGGVQILCFLLAQVDDLASPVVTSNRSPRLPGKFSESRGGVDPVLCTDAFFGLISDLLRGSSNTKHALQTNLLSIINALLKEAASAYLSVEALMSMQLLLECASPFASFVRTVLKELILDFDIWKEAPMAVRLGHVQLVTSFLKTHKLFCRKYYGVTFLLDALRNMHHDDPEEEQVTTKRGKRPAAPLDISSAEPLSPIRRVQGEDDGEMSSGSEGSGSACEDNTDAAGLADISLQGEHMQGESDRSKSSSQSSRNAVDEQVRRALLSVVKFYMTEGLSTSETEAIFNFCATCENSAILIEFLEFLRSCLLEGFNDYDRQRKHQLQVQQQQQQQQQQAQQLPLTQQQQLQQLLASGKSPAGIQLELALCKDGAPMMLYGLLSRPHRKVRECALWLIVYFSTDSYVLSEAEKERMRIQDVGLEGVVDVLKMSSISPSFIAAFLAMGSVPVVEESSAEVTVEEDKDAVVLSFGAAPTNATLQSSFASEAESDPLLRHGEGASASTPSIGRRVDIDTFVGMYTGKGVSSGQRFEDVIARRYLRRVVNPLAIEAVFSLVGQAQASSSRARKRRQSHSKLMLDLLTQIFSLPSNCLKMTQVRGWQVGILQWIKEVSVEEARSLRAVPLAGLRSQRGGSSGDEKSAAEKSTSQRSAERMFDERGELLAPPPAPSAQPPPGFALSVEATCEFFKHELGLVPPASSGVRLLHDILTGLFVTSGTAWTVVEQTLVFMEEVLGDTSPLGTGASTSVSSASSPGLRPTQSSTSSFGIDVGAQMAAAFNEAAPFRTGLTPDVLKGCLLILLLRSSVSDFASVTELSENLQTMWACNVIHICMLVEEFLFCDTPIRRTPREAKTHEALRNALYDFAQSMDILFDKSFGRLSVGLSLVPQEASRVRPSGMGRLGLRLLVTDLVSGELMRVSKAARLLQHLVNSPDIRYINRSRAMLLVWHLDGALTTSLSTESSELTVLLVSLLRRLLRTYDCGLANSGASSSPETAASIGPVCEQNDPRLMDSSDPQLMLQLMANAPWRHFINTTVAPVVGRLMDAEWVERGSMASAYNDHASKVRELVLAGISAKTFAHRTSVGYIRGAILDPFHFFRCKDEWARLKRLENSRISSRIRAGYRWQALVNFMLGPRGFLDDGIPKAEKEIKHWKMDRSENFSRMRLKLCPNLRFNPHDDASFHRDNARGSSSRHDPTPSSAAGKPDRSALSKSDFGLKKQQQQQQQQQQKQQQQQQQQQQKQLQAQPHGAGHSPQRGLENRSLSMSLSMSIESPAAEPSDRLDRGLAAGLRGLEGSEQERELEMATESLLLSKPCRMVTLMDVAPGTLMIFKTHVVFLVDSEFAMSEDRLENDDFYSQDFDWPIEALREIHFRRHNLRPCALELFLMDQTNFFLTFEKGEREEVYDALVAMEPPNLLLSGRARRTPAELLQMSGLTEKWRRRLISNFDYLMQLNTIAGRSYNDLNQYPVFPWVLADYTSEKLDLGDPKSFRDLTKPIGALNSNRAEMVRAMYKDFEDPLGIVEKFHYGTHYSNAAGVLHYMLRLEPFTSLHIHLQSGKFDHADRQFHSLAMTWHGIEAGAGDVKELIPEFFYLPEFLLNMNRFDLGKTQSGVVVDDVVLPKWASTPEEFIRLHRQALESDHVSAHLHHWIDLIFGYKQRGPAAEEALNVFYYTSYEGAVDLDKIEDPQERRAQEGMIREFGQTPSQLLTSPHPQRLTKTQAARINEGNKSGWLTTPSPSTPMPVLDTDEVESTRVFDNLGRLKAYFVTITQGDPVAAIFPPNSGSFRSWLARGLMQRLITVTADGQLGVHDWLPSSAAGGGKDDSSGAGGAGRRPFNLDVDTTLTHNRSRFLDGVFEQDVPVTHRILAVTRDGCFLVCGGGWDNSLRIASSKTRKSVFCAVAHTDVVTSVGLGRDDSVCVSGSRNGICMVWTMRKLSDTVAVLDGPKHILYGHTAEVTSIAIVSDMDMVVSASLDGACMVHTHRAGEFIRAIRPSLPTQRLADLDVNHDSTNPRVSLVPGANKELFVAEKDGLIHDAVPSIELVSLGEHGITVLYAQWSSSLLKKRLHTLHVYSCNGRLIASEGVSGKITDMKINLSNEFLVTSSRNGAVTIRELHSLHVVHNVNLHIPIHCFALTESEDHIMLGLRDGKLIIIAVSRSQGGKALSSTDV